MKVSFLICDFAKETLSNLVKECFGSDFPDIIQKTQINSIYNHLNSLEAKTVLLEPDYVDRDYLEDYARYYVKCFNRYGERCARLHFFAHEFDHTTFSKVFEDPDPNELIANLKKHYLGFVVIKPLPKTFIGKTCLKPNLASSKHQSSKLLERTYTADLFGIPLKVNTVAFQEQDKVLSACATTSIWNALQALDFHDARNVPSCSEITLAAINHIIDSANSFPNKGLSNKQILRALDIQCFRNHQIHLTCFNRDNKSRTFRLIKGYLDSRRPIILGAEVYTCPDGQLQLNGSHAVTIVGYSEDDQQQCLFVHDDRIGPFIKATFEPLKSKTKRQKLVDSWGLALAVKSENGDWASIKQWLLPNGLIVPNHRKVRISAQDIDNTCVAIVEEFNGFLAEIIEKKATDRLNYQLTYTFNLASLSDVRSRILKDPRISNKKAILTKSAARFLWSAKFSLNNELSMEILFDATDIPQGRAISDIVDYNNKNSDLILAAFKRFIDEDVSLPESPSNGFLSAFIGSLKQQDSGISEYLDNQYGELRAPKRLKKEEIINGRLQIQQGIVKNYGRTNKRLDDDFPDFSSTGQKFLIWAISADGALLIGREIDDKGHPTLTGFKPARIAGELHRDSAGWLLNSKSGRYSTDYANVNELLDNALQKFLEVYNLEDSKTLRIKPFTPE